MIIKYRNWGKCRGQAPYLRDEALRSKWVKERDEKVIRRQLPSRHWGNPLGIGMGGGERTPARGSGKVEPTDDPSPPTRIPRVCGDSPRPATFQRPLWGRSAPVSRGASPQGPRSGLRGSEPGRARPVRRSTLDASLALPAQLPEGWDHRRQLQAMLAHSEDALHSSITTRRAPGVSTTTSDEEARRPTETRGAQNSSRKPRPVSSLGLIRFRVGPGGGLAAVRGRGEGRDALRSGFPGKVLSEPGAPGRRDLLVLVFSCSALSLPATEAQRSQTSESGDNRGVVGTNPESLASETWKLRQFSS